MEQSSPVMPLRPLTFGELLDAAVLLLRTHARLFLLAALLLAVCEQAVLFPFRAAAGNSGVGNPFTTDDGSDWWLLFCLGLTTESVVLVLLGGLTAAAAGPALLGRRAADRAVLQEWGQRAPTLLLLAALTALILLPSALLALPWLYCFGAFGLAAPAVMIDRSGFGGALARSVRLASARLRGVVIRLGAYCGWSAIRLALGWGTAALLEAVLPHGGPVGLIATIAVWVLANTVAYAALACLDAMLYLEIRMRVEGLDVAIGRSRRLGRPVDLAWTAVFGGVTR